MRFSENRSEEIEALVKVVEHYPEKEWKHHTLWFFRQIQDLVERQLAEES